MSKFSKIAAVVAGTLISSSAFSATWVADARGNAMGNTGVTTADFVVAPFYNPALTAVYRDKDNFGLLLPAININARDTSDSLTTIDDIQSLVDELDQYEADPANADLSVIDRLNEKLDALSDDQPLGVTAGIGLAVALPINTLSVNLFSRSYLELLVDQDIAPSTDATTIEDKYYDLQDRLDNAYVDLLAFGYTEFGLAFAKQFNIYNQQVSFGISPKLQKLITYKQHVVVDDFDVENYDQSKTTKDAFNLDLGAVWIKDSYRTGIVVKDLFKQKIDTANENGVDSYTLNPQVTVSAGYVSEFFTAGIDVDLTEQERFSTSEDNTQFARIGVEGNAWGWAQLRAGYEIDMAGTLDNSITAGIGISPFDVVSLDLAASYAGSNQAGVSMNLEFTF